MNETFMAGVQYGDLKGTSAADQQDVESIEGWLKKNHQDHHIDSNDNFVGLSMHASKISKQSINVSFFFVNLKNGQTVPDLITSSKNGVPVKKINIDMNASEFIGLFKRLNVTLSSKGIVEGVEYDVQ